MNKHNTIISEIKNADSAELSAIVQAVIARYRVLFPNEEVIFLSLSREDRAERAWTLRQAAERIERQE